MKEPIFLTPIFQERIWGGSRLKDVYNYPIKSPLTGECWAISAHPNGESSVRCGKYKGLKLSELWNNHRQFFGNHGSEKFPLLTKIIDANEDLSVQVHPDDDYAKEHENGESGKTECWYIIDCTEGADIIVGHHAQTKQEFINKVKSGSWDQLLQRIKIKPGDFFYIPSGTLHAICKGTLLIETQQNSDTTYRVYDYNRRDENGNLRELHLQKALDVITIPHKESNFNPNVLKTNGATIITFIENDYFTVSKWIIKDQLSMKQNQTFMLFSVIEGKGFLETCGQKYELSRGDHFILPYELCNFNIKGNIQFIVSYPSIQYRKESR
ncbi:mannose-6-phosphate isomerase, class I [Priestia megaterium]|uniref:mannose-6-phosphate isomerase, class I n=1 Tax=Priestia megaterium TaxID=1404 RepID=UPI00101DB4A5|nr:mannose-6-phosphate isomerase, class I [Priestia megaterium]